MALSINFVYKTPMGNSTTDKENCSPFKTMMDLLARREHSEKELRTKLSVKFGPQDVELAIQHGKNKGWIANNEATLNSLSEETANGLHRKGKGILFINEYLREKGLPEVSADSRVELEKALALVKNKKLNFEGLEDTESQKVKAKMARLLASRGFDNEVIGKVIHEEL